MTIQIDFVLPWLDPTDPEWIHEYNTHSIEQKIISSNPRYRDWDNLIYWFRGVEKYAPWVNKIHFITYGHLPKWLNTKHPKLNIVNHSDYIETLYLPTFSSHTIELNMHKIPFLSENFVYFNDDTFLINPINKSFYFNQHNQPMDSCIFNAIVDDGDLSFYLLNNLKVIEKHFNKFEAIKKKPSNFINFKYGSLQLKSLLLTPWKKFTGFQNFHLPQPFKKSIFEELWDVEKDLLEKTCSNRFRSKEDVNQYLFKYWQLLSGTFEPSNINKTGRCISPCTQNFKEIENLFSSKFMKVICINDSNDVDDFDLSKEFVNSLLDSKLPNKSLFEI